ncbi:virulence-associated protein VapP [Prescottella equi]|uniref:Virulence-associated protein VapP n=1 Tax=Rhodococcus hoagii TaxID=43767 RepID=A0A0F7ICF0_RHOHA|nr:virulence-associated protein VapP [Prescottella equi]AKG90534.1 virulence-associated protein VapP [Prescottella equi]
MYLSQPARKFLVRTAVPVTIVMALAVPRGCAPPPPLPAAPIQDPSAPTHDPRVGPANYSDGTVLVRASSNIPEPVIRSVSEQQQWTVNGVLASALVYQRLTLTVEGGEKFEGYAGGLSIPGAGIVWGTLFTDDIQRLYDGTESFEFNAVGPYLNVNFFDGRSTLLGHAQLGGVSSVIGIGGGTGTWKGEVA